MSPSMEPMTSKRALIYVGIPQAAIHLYNEHETESAFEIVMRHDSHGRAERERKTERETELKEEEWGRG